MEGLLQRRLLPIVVFAVSGCGPSGCKGSAPPASQTVVADAATPVAAPTADAAPSKEARLPCPNTKDLDARLHNLWSVPPNREINVGSCLPGHFPQPGWFIEANVDLTPEKGSEVDGAVQKWERGQERWVVITSAANKIIAAREDSPRAKVLENPSESDHYEVADFDGDGVDEIVETTEGHGLPGESSSDYFTVFRLHDGKFDEALNLTTSYDSTESVEVEDEDKQVCTAKVEITPPSADHKRKLIVTGKITKGTKKDPRCPIGKNVWTLPASGKFIQESPPRK